MPSTHGRPALGPLPASALRPSGGWRSPCRVEEPTLLLRWLSLSFSESV